MELKARDTSHASFQDSHLEMKMEKEALLENAYAEINTLKVRVRVTRVRVRVRVGGGVCRDNYLEGGS